MIWSVENLDRWLADPQQFVPGAKMPVRVLEKTSRRDIIAYLQKESGGPDQNDKHRATVDRILKLAFQCRRAAVSKGDGSCQAS